jgi:hypothetical protein
MLSSRTYNDTENGTYGQYVPAPNEADAVSGTERATLIQLTRNSEYRTNIGFTNLGAGSLDVVVDLFTHGGVHLGSKGYAVGPYSFFQVTDILGKIGAENIDDAYAVVHSSNADAAYFTYATIIDNRTGDPIYASPAVAAARPIYIAAAAHLRGANRTNWRTDLEVFNSGNTRARFQIELLRRNRPNTDPARQIFFLEPGKSVRYGDVLDSVFGFSGAAALRITPIEGEIAATSRTYNQLEDGTTGQFAKAAHAADAIAAGDSARLIQLSESASTSDGYRTNIGLTSISGQPSSVDVELYDGDGTHLGRVTEVLEPYEFIQIDRIFNRVTSDAIDDGYALLSSSSDGALFLAYASVIDNRSGDPIYIPARVWAPTKHIRGPRGLDAEAHMPALPVVAALGMLAVTILVVRRRLNGKERDSQVS